MKDHTARQLTALDFAAALSPRLLPRRARATLRGIAGLTLMAISGAALAQTDAGGSAAAKHVSSFEIEVRYEAMDERAWLADIRLEGADQLLVGSKGTGILRLARASAFTVLERDIATRPGGRYSASAWQVASSERFIVAAQVVGSISWNERGQGDLRVFHGFDGIRDVDVFGDRVAIMAARRDGPGGSYAEDGSIVSIGILGETLEDLRPLHFSIDGPGAEAYENCSFLQTGHLRYLRDGRLIVLPGGEPGIYRYSPEGLLEKSWRTESLGIDIDCGFSDRRSEETAGSLELQLAWRNDHTVVDDIVPLGAGPGLIVRRIEGGQATWQLWILHRHGEITRHRLPFRRPPYQRIQADADGDRLALLFDNMLPTSDPPQGIAIVSLPKSAKRAKSSEAKDRR